MVDLGNLSRPVSSERPHSVRRREKRRIRIAHIQLLPLLSGVQRVTLEELVRLDPDIYDRTLICREPGPLSEELERHGVHCQFCPDLTRPIAPHLDYSALRTLQRMMREGKFDIVHTHSSKTGILGRLAATWARVPAVVHTVHGFAFPAAKSRAARYLYRTIEQIGGRNCNAVVCLNENDRNIAERELGISRNCLHVIPNCVDPIHFAKASSAERHAIRNELKIPVDVPIVTMVGRLWRQKSPQTFVEAAARLIKNGSRAHFVVIGDGELRTGLEDIIHENNVTTQLHLLGWRSDVPRILAASDLFVLPSLWEGMPLAILEAMASHLPCIVSDIPGNRDLVADGKNGFLFPAGDIETLTDRIEVLLTDPHRCRQFGEASRLIVERDYDISTRNRVIQRLYSELLDSAFAISSRHQ